MKSGPDKFTLLMRYLDGKLSGDELRAVNALLRTDADARQWLREISHQAFALGDIARERSVEGKPTTITMATTAAMVSSTMLSGQNGCPMALKWS